MKRLARLFGIALVVGSAWAILSPEIRGGRSGGPLTTAVTVPAGQSVYLDIRFEAGDTAIVTIAGTGRSMMQVNIYDSDGHVAVGVGRGDRKTASMDVYRAGIFRVEITNWGIYENTATITTN